MSTKEDILSSIDRKLTILMHLEAYLLIGDKTITEGAPILKRLGMKPSEIAAVFDTTSRTVSVRLSESKKKR
jgi:hypothetical protein